MTSSIPSSFSSDDLQRLLETAKPEPEVQPKGEGPHGKQGLTDEQVVDLAGERLDCMEECSDPIVHKVMMHMICHNMIEWHTRMGERLAEEGQPDAATAWLRDAGKWQSIAIVLDTINVSDNDFTCDQEG